MNKKKLKKKLRIQTELYEQVRTDRQRLVQDIRDLHRLVTGLNHYDEFCGDHPECSGCRGIKTKLEVILAPYKPMIEKFNTAVREIYFPIMQEQMNHPPVMWEMATDAERREFRDEPIQPWCEYCTPRRLYHATQHPEGE